MVAYIKIRDELRNKPNQNINNTVKSKVQNSLVSLFAFVSLICITFIILALISVARNEAQQEQRQEQHLVCYLTTTERNALSLLNIPGDLCTHINIGTADLVNNTLILSQRLKNILQNETHLYRAAHPQVKLLLWIGGADSGHEFSQMVVNHAHRKEFLRSLRDVLHKYPSIDGIDLDWEFPRPYDKEPMHFSQLMHEIRLEWVREQRSNRLLTLAVAAPEGIAFFGYNIREINLYVDFVNLMTYDFHFFSEHTPFTGLNAPLYARPNEKSLMGTFNINYTVHWWLRNGLEPRRLVIGLPTYGHSFRLVSPFNKGIGAPTSGFGQCGEFGFTTFSETCECANSFVTTKFTYDNSSCSPYLSALYEWISYESKTSIECKAHYVKSLNVGGLMIFSLNTDDIRNSCGYMPKNVIDDSSPVFPLAQMAKNILSNT